MTEQEKLIDKIQKLLNKGHGTDNPEEAAIFLGKAAAMMEEHNITNRTLGRAQLGEAVMKSTQSVSKPKDWEQSLMVVVGKAFGCKTIWRPGHSRNADYWGRWVYIGSKDQVLLAEYSATFLLRTLVRARTEYSYKLSYRGFRRGKEMSGHLDAFCKGWIAVVRTKVAAFVNDQALQDLIDEWVAEISTGKTNPHNRGDNIHSRLMGQDAASDVHLHRPMDKEEQLRLS